MEETIEQVAKKFVNLLDDSDQNQTMDAEFVNKLKADMTAWKEFSEDQEDGEDDGLNRVYENRRFNNLQIGQQDNIGNQPHQNPRPQRQPIFPPPPAFQAPLSHQDIMKM
uniref:Uncharacterized protein n=1 Tax=Romanomermis culicivorax TaxID=13658 RepID=A0A915JS78_ROMCU